MIAFGLTEVKSSLALMREFIETGFGVRRCRSFTELRSIYTDPSVCAVVSQSDLDGADGLEFCRGFRSEVRGRLLPLIMLSPEPQSDGCARFIDAGADSCLPFGTSSTLLVASVRSVLRRIEWDQSASPLLESPSSPAASVLESAGIVVQLKEFAATLNGQPLDLTPSELRILIAIMSSAEGTCTRGELFRSVRHSGTSVNDRSLDSHVYSLRRKLGAEGKYLKTLRGLGYRWTAAIRFH